MGTAVDVLPGGEEPWARAAECFVQWRDGDPQALDDLVKLLSPVLWHVVRAHGLEREPAEDVVQTTWVAFVRSHAAIADPRAVSAWLTTTARREAWRALRGRGKDTPIEDEMLEAVMPTAQSTEASVVDSDDRSRLWECVRKLPQRCQRLIRVVAFESRPDYRSLSAELDMPIGSIGPTRGRCLARLRELLGEGQQEEFAHG